MRLPTEREQQELRENNKRISEGLASAAPAMREIANSMNAFGEACQKLTHTLEVFAWTLPGQWPDPFVILKRADRTGVRELAFGGELWGYPRPVLKR